MREIERMGEALRFETTRFWFNSSDIRGWVRSVEAGVGTVPALLVKNSKPLMIADTEAVVGELVAVVNKDGSVMEAP